MIPLAGCRIVQTAADVPGKSIRAVTQGKKKDQRAVDPVEVQQTLLRFADEYATRMIISVDKLRHGTNAPDAAEILKWKIALNTQIVSIAAGQNAVADLLDMTVFATMVRLGLEERWQAVFGESAQPLLESAKNGETGIWRLAATVLTPKQLEELRHSVDVWHSQNPLPESVLAVRSLGVAAQIAETSKEEASQPGSVFSLLNLDPLAGIDPAVREISQTRLLAERGLFVTQKMPTLLRWQTELLSLNATDLPAVRQLVANTTQVSATAERFATVAEKLPGQVSAERAEILKALQSQEKDVSSLLNSGTQFSTSLNTTLTTLDGFMTHMGVGDTNKVEPPKTNAEPFRIQDYTATAAQLDATARQLTELLVTLDRTIGSTNLLKLSAQVSPILQQAQSGGRELVNFAFWKGVLLVALALMAALVYRFSKLFLTSAKLSKTNSP